MTSPTPAELRAAVQEWIDTGVHAMSERRRQHIVALLDDHERLEREVEALREALEAMCWHQTGECDYDCGHPSCQGRQQARRVYAAVMGAVAADEASQLPEPASPPLRPGDRVLVEAEVIDHTERRDDLLALCIAIGDAPKIRVWVPAARVRRA